MADLGVPAHGLILEPVRSPVLSQRVTSDGLSQDLAAVLVIFVFGSIRLLYLFAFLSIIHKLNVFLPDDFFKSSKHF